VAVSARCITTRQRAPVAAAGSASAAGRVSLAAIRATSHTARCRRPGSDDLLRASTAATGLYAVRRSHQQQLLRHVRSHDAARRARGLLRRGVFPQHSSGLRPTCRASIANQRRRQLGTSGTLDAHRAGGLL